MTTTLGICECYYLVSSFIFWIVEFLGLAAPEWFFSWLSFHFVNKNLCVIYFPLCLFLLTLCAHTCHLFRSQFHFSTGIFSNSKERADNLPLRLDGCNLELFEASRHWWASRRKVLVVRMDVADWWVSGRNTTSSGLLIGNRNKLPWKLHRIFLKNIAEE
jgi:hypothetical protein